jgi:hypothetical protein
MGVVKSPAKTGLPRFLVDRVDPATMHVRDQQFNRVGADINDRTANGFHSGPKIRNRPMETKGKIVTFCRPDIGSRHSFSTLIYLDSP